jgi:hypothetical protein
MLDALFGKMGGYITLSWVSAELPFEYCLEK